MKEVIVKRKNIKSAWEGHCFICGGIVGIDHIYMVDDNKCYIKCGASGIHFRASESTADYVAIIQTPLTILAKRFK
jgi:hypothetical protein